MNSKLVKYFTVNAVFINYLDQFPNLTESLEFPFIKSKTTFEQILPISLNVSKFDSDLLTASSNLKDFIHQYTHKNRIFFHLKERHDNMALISNKNFFSDNYVIDVFLFIAAIISLLVTTFTIYLLCKQKKKLRTIITSLVLQQVKEVGTVTQKEINTECKILIIYKFGFDNFGTSDGCNSALQKIKLCRGCMFSNAVKIMMFISDVQYYVPIKLCKTTGSINVSKIFRHAKFRK